MILFARIEIKTAARLVKGLLTVSSKQPPYRLNRRNYDRLPRLVRKLQSCIDRPHARDWEWVVAHLQETISRREKTH
jgi:hypothetical protein